MSAAPDSARQDKATLDAAFADLYKAHLRDVYSYSYYRVGNHHDAEDLTEQTFLQAYRHFERARKESQGRPLRPCRSRTRPTRPPTTSPTGPRVPQPTTRTPARSPPPPRPEAWRQTPQTRRETCGA